jgi:HSP20 family protein
MARSSQELAPREKQELQTKEERTQAGRYYSPATDITETPEALTVIMEIPGAEQKDVSLALENDVLRVDARIDFSKYEGMEPVYSEYNVGHYTRAFTLSSKVDQSGIAARLADGVLTLTLPKVQEAIPRKIPIK